MVESAARRREKEEDFEMIIGIISIAIIGLILWWVCPSAQKMEAEVSRSIVEEQLQKIAHVTQLDQYLEVDADHLSDEEVIEKAEKLGTIRVKNWGVVKLAYFTKLGKKKEHFAAIGLCGFVITKSTIKDLAN